MSVIERDGEILPSYADKENGNAPHMPGYDRAIPHETYSAKTGPEQAQSRGSLPGVHIEEVDQFEHTRGLTVDEARALNESAAQERGGRPVDPDILR